MQHPIIWSRVEAVAAVLSLVPGDAIRAVETSDPQYRAARMIAGRHGAAAAAIMAANALISYRLMGRGEDYWMEYARWMVRQKTPSTGAELVKLVKEFLFSSRINRAARRHKASRLEKAEPVLDRLLRRPESYRDLGVLVVELRQRLPARGPGKTIFFAAKMAYYAFSVLGVKADISSIDSIPVDRRVALITSSSMMVDARPEELTVRGWGSVIEAWRGVSKHSRIPVLQIDTLIWLPLPRSEPYLRRGLLASARDRYAESLMEYSSGLIPWSLAHKIASQLLYRSPWG
ncbi:MAG: N-glycosylase/DNA lyase [Crenarchaeota archaeon]|nr:N-glycosylase/DNA lyase [Thermoproteota archaeon]